MIKIARGLAARERETWNERMWEREFEIQSERERGTKVEIETNGIRIRRSQAYLEHAGGRSARRGLCGRKDSFWNMRAF
ncbi:hypothetical protein EVAR_8782_1 [Eumeta japonica]|uniref:Uncharacterized protein n=1 Tax=Eumeta variegata TaxID=151549 RepID=A0A4C1TTS5_EUMVA|nr:hypothetical protein EVAR_8782_1 [Eumeta japonica]